MYYLTQQKAQRQRVSCVPGLWVCCPAIFHAALAQQPDNYSSSRHHFQRSRQRKGLTISSMCLFLKSEKMFLQQSSHHIIIGQARVTCPFLNQSLEKGTTYFSLIIWRWNDVWRVNHPVISVYLNQASQMFVQFFVCFVLSRLLIS